MRKFLLIASMALVSGCGEKQPKTQTWEVEFENACLVAVKDFFEFDEVSLLSFKPTLKQPDVYFNCRKEFLPIDNQGYEDCQSKVLDEIEADRSKFDIKSGPMTLNKPIDVRVKDEDNVVSELNLMCKLLGYDWSEIPDDFSAIEIFELIEDSSLED